MAWSDIAGKLNQAMLDEFGDTFECVPTGAASTVPFIGVKGKRSPLENEQYAAYERIWTRYSQLPSFPLSGWIIQDGQTQYAVFTAKPDPDDPTGDAVILYLKKN